MARHAAPRSPYRWRPWVFGGLSALGVAATVALGVLVAPSTLLKSPVSPWSTPPSVTSSTPTRSTPPARPTPTPTASPAETSEVPPPPPAPAPSPTEVPTETAGETLERTTEAPRPTTPAPAPRPSSVPSSTPPDPPPPPAPAPEPEVQIQLGPLDLSLDLPNANLWAADVAPQVADIKRRFNVGTVMTRPGHSPDQQHAADFMTSDQAKGDAIAAYALSLPGVEYIIWQQRYNDGSGWSLMADRGGITANHFDHVHVSFY